MSRYETILAATLVVAGAAVAVPHAASAGALGTPERSEGGTIPVDPGRGVTGTLTAQAPRQAWELDLERGRAYAVRGNEANDALVSVVAAGGAVLGRFTLGSDDQAQGVSFRAPYTGRYTVLAEEVDCPGGGCTQFPDTYSLSAERDCPGDASTRCVLAVGRILRGLRLDFEGDTDAFRTILRGGRHYALTAVAQSYCLHLEVDDARGRAVASLGCVDRTETLDFAAPANGGYFVRVIGDGLDTQPYSLSLRQVR